MAELRTIQQAEIRNFPDRGFLLRLDDQYSVIPYPMQSLGIRIPGRDQYILVIGPTGLFLLSYHIIYSHEAAQHFMSLARNMEQTGELLYRYLFRYNQLLPAIQLLMVVNDGNIYGPATEKVLFVPWSKIRSEIEGAPPVLAAEQIYNLLDILKAEVLFQRIHRYQTLCVLKRGENQVKYLAIDTVENKQVVVKEVSVSSDLDHLERNAIIRGAKLTQELIHENIIRVEKIFPLDQKIYIVTEWHEGGITLKQYLEDHPGTVPMPTAIQLIKDLCHALMYAHDKGVIHRNLTPDSLLVTPEHRLKVFNFDLAKKSGIHTLQSTDLRRLTHENPYSAPEYMLGTHKVDQRVDVYSVGVIFYELLTGKRPTHYDELLWDPPSRMIPGLPSYIDNLIARAIKFDKNQRYSTIHALYNALDKGASELIGLRYEIIDDEVHKQTESSLIYKVRDTRDGEILALKKVFFQPVSTSPVTNRAQRLMRLQGILEPLSHLQDFEHPGLVSVVDTLLENDDAYVVMEWIEGRNLREVLDTYPAHEGLIPETVRQIGIQLAEVLQYIHQEGYIHGDIKPENVMLSEGGKVTLLDFVPRTFDESLLPEDIPQTLRYMAPELHNQAEMPDERSDIFSLGLLMYELLTHQFPFEVAQLRQAKHTGQLPALQKLSNFNPIVPQNLEQAIMKALAYNPRDRHDSFSSFLMALETKLLLPQTPPESPRPQHPKAFKFLDLPRLVGLTAILTLIMMTIYLINTGLLLSQKPILREVYYE